MAASTHNFIVKVGALGMGEESMVMFDMIFDPDDLLGSAQKTKANMMAATLEAFKEFTLQYAEMMRKQQGEGEDV